MKTILFPTDFSERANRALEQAINVAEKSNARLILYHVYHRPVLQGETNEQTATWLKQLEEGIDVRFQKLAHQFPRLKKLNCEYRKELGISVESIAHIPKNEDISLIMMATEGATGLGELWGTKTAQIIKSVKVPVLVIPDNTHLAEVSKIGLVCDYSEQTHYQTLDFLLDFIELFQLNVDVITFNRDEKTMTYREEANRELVKKKLENVAATFHFTYNGEVEEGIVGYSNTNNIGMIAILPKSYSFIERLFRESLTEKMVFHSNLPLLVLK